MGGGSGAVGVNVATGGGRDDDKDDEDDGDDEDEDDSEPDSEDEEDYVDGFMGDGVEKGDQDKNDGDDEDEDDDDDDAKSSVSLVTRPGCHNGCCHDDGKEEDGEKSRPTPCHHEFAHLICHDGCHDHGEVKNDNNDGKAGDKSDDLLVTRPGCHNGCCRDDGDNA